MKKPDGRPQFGTWLHSPSVLGAELLAVAKWNFLVVDLQHSLSGFDAGVSLITATTNRSMPTLVRVTELDASLIGRVLDAGASGIICPMVNSAEDAEKFVSACSYPPSGVRSFGPIRARLLWGDEYISLAGNGLAKFAMIETGAGLSAVREIARTPGLSGLLVGPNDLALSLGLSPKMDPDDSQLLKVFRDIKSAASNAGISCGIACESPNYVRQMASEGFQYFIVSSDLRMMAARSAQLLQEIGNGDSE
jgi:4-hydroxy-2-oxoheptanedioate aldolase